MGGGAFWSMLRVGIFFVLIWGASRLSRMAGVSSIVLEITTGLILSPSFLGLMPKDYAECNFEMDHDCETLHAQNVIQDHIPKKCDYNKYMKNAGVALLPPPSPPAKSVSYAQLSF